MPCVMEWHHTPVLHIASLLMNSTCATEFELGVGQIVGLSFVAEAGCLSIMCILIFFAMVARNSIALRRHPFRSAIDIYVTSLFVAELLLGVVAVMSIRWAQKGMVQCGAHCTIQGLLGQFGQTGVAMSHLAITIHTFCVIFFQWEPPSSTKLPLCVVACIWLYNILFAAIGYGVHAGNGDAQPLYIPSPFWCWLYPSAKGILFTQYFWPSLSLLASISLHVLLFFSVRGNVEILEMGSKWYNFKIKLASTPASSSNMARAVITPTRIMPSPRSVAKSFLWYPAAYAISTVPRNIGRWGALTRFNSTIPAQDAAVAFICVLWFVCSTSGAINVALFAFTRPNIFLFGVRRDSLRQAVQIELGVVSSALRSAPTERNAFNRRENTRDSARPPSLSGNDSDSVICIEPLPHRPGTPPVTATPQAALYPSESWTVATHAYPSSLSLVDPAIQEVGFVLPRSPPAIYAESRGRRSRARV
ncbi:hypothetical protein BOTBODRAFT_412180 [Botryobasidium botryosum FD-172 SS1]|uniref:Uncharacterized protein n=1 Tax=Botryobasidium botryosum (strain FD-172 SS1) TaxID=930990 RepID=A0A067MAF8_BOTB1|nr:hypothetical protein BOTBODRAFT_412180 [Botryobasidium botryosum FD-172 SS1]